MSIHPASPRGLRSWLLASAVLVGLVVAGCKSPTASDPPTPANLELQQSLAIERTPECDGRGPPSPSLGAFAVYATEALEMNGGSLITGGAVGIEKTTGPYLGGNAAAYFNSGAKIESTQTLYAYTTYLNSGVSLGPIDTDKILGNPGATHGEVSSFPAMPTPPSTPSATPGSTSITLNSGQSKTLVAGAYGSVMANGALTLTGGTYVFASLTLNSGGSLAVAGATTLSITGSLNVGSGASLAPTSASGLTAKGLVIYLDSSSGVNLNSGVVIRALVVATKAEVQVNTSKFTGALAAAQVLMNSGGTVTFQDGLGSLVSGGTNLCTGVVCSASDACHVAGVCDTSTGVCSNPTASNGTSCSDGNACTQVDTCQAGVCTGADPVTCTASDECHVAGTCNTSTGACSNPTASNGTSCNDGNACTQADTCQAGVCTGADPVTCTASDACHVAGVCNTSTGACSNPTASNGTSCSDGNACTQVDTCQAGVCTGADPVTCAASDQCHPAGTCSPSTGTCSNPTASNGTSCSDGNACTKADSCQSGVCTGSNPVTCTASDSCHVAGTCSPSTGACTNPAATNGTSCNDGNACTQADSCQSGVCTGRTRSPAPRPTPATWPVRALPAPVRARIPPRRTARAATMATRARRRTPARRACARGRIL